jgi:hypothetical protein
MQRSTPESEQVMDAGFTSDDPENPVNWSQVNHLGPT